MIDLHDECTRISDLGKRGRNPKAVREVELALASKWEGLRVVASRVLAKWGDPESIAALKSSLVEIASKNGSHSATGQLAKSLAPHLTLDDLGWAIDLFFNQSHGSSRFFLYEIFSNLPPKEVLDAIDKSSPAYRGKASHLSGLRAWVSASPRK